LDAHRFDTLARSLSFTGSRRTALAALLGGTLGLLSLADTAAKKGKNRKKNNAPPPMEPPMDPPLEPGTPPMDPPPKRQRRGKGGKGGWFQP